MTTEARQAVLAFETGLAIGSPVTLCYTYKYRFFRMPAEVARLTNETITARVVVDQRGTSGAVIWPKGQLLTVPRYAEGSKWSVQNRVEPEGGYA
jgi:hypothetical protein